MVKLRSAEVLAECLRLRGVTLAEAGRRAGCSRQFIFRLTSGARVACSSDIATALAGLVGVEVGSLFLPDESGLTGTTVCHDRESAA